MLRRDTDNRIVGPAEKAINPELYYNLKGNI